MIPGKYETIWNSLSQTEPAALMHVAGYTDEAELRANTEVTLAVLRSTIGINPSDVCLEIGCGVGRVGQHLARLCREWIGCDVSRNMLDHACKRLAGHDNVRLVKTSGTDLAPIPSESVDAVYCTVVFMHLEPWERYAYATEAFRVLRPGGRFYCDAINLASDDGWKVFQAGAQFAPDERPFHISRCCTIPEIQVYLDRAGFSGTRVETRHLWVQGWGTKSG